jgi:hypothetical protein
MPLALIQITTVVNSPRSADVREPTCFLPLAAIIFDGRDWTVVIPVSSTLNILDGGKLCFSWSDFKISKNEPTASRLKPCALAAEVA